jgi:hypothetical protein
MRKQRYLMLFAVGWAAGLITLGLATANASSADIAHSYHSNSSIATGSLVSLDPNQSNYVDLANTDNVSRLIGVTVANNNSLLVLDPSSGSVQVAISGSVVTLVSTLNGDINIGDQISVSPFSGVGMKALPGSRVIGNALTTLNPSTNNVTTQVVTDKSGHKSQIYVGYIRINIATGSDTAGSQAGLNSIEKLADTIAGHPVSPIRIALSVTVAIFALLALSILIYATIHASIIAVGRNPLARSSVFRIIVYTMIMVIITVGLACVSIYVLLR